MLHICLTALCGCAPYQTKPWHQALNRPVPFWIGPLQPADLSTAEEPPRGPDTDFARIQLVHVGMHGGDILRLTGQDPFYAREAAFLTTYIHGRCYEVAFRYAPDGSGRIVDISYLPVTDEQVQRSRGPG
jgi:hypothetical protein